MAQIEELNPKTYDNYRLIDLETIVITVGSFIGTSLVDCLVLAIYYGMQ